MEQSTTDFKTAAMNSICAAEKMDASGNASEAILLYKEGINYLFELLKLEQDIEMQQLLRNKVIKLMQRATTLQDQLNGSEPLSQPKQETQLAIIAPNTIQKQDLPNSIPSSLTPFSNMNVKCEEEVHIENVTCFAVYTDSESCKIAQGPMMVISVPISKNRFPQLFEKAIEQKLGTIKSDESGQDETIMFTFLQIGEDLRFPLIPSLPCLRISKTTFLFPMQAEDYFISFALPQDIPDVYSDLIERKLAELCVIRRNYPEEDADEHISHANQEIVLAGEFQQVQSVSKPIEHADGSVSLPNQELIEKVRHTETLATATLTKLASGIDYTSEYFVHNINGSSEWIASSLNYTSLMLRDYLTPAEEELKIPSVLSSTVHYGSKVTPSFVSVSGGLVNGLVAVAGALGTVIGNMAPTRISSSETGLASYGPVKAATEVGKASMRGVANIWEALDKAGEVVVKEAGKEAVELARHKYGAEAGVFVAEGMSLTGDVIQTVYNVKSMGVKKIAKKAAKETGKKAVTTYVVKGTDQDSASESQCNKKK